MTDFSNRPWWIGNKIKVDQSSRCEFCNRYEGQSSKVFYGNSYVTILKDHFEKHLEEPRTITVCTSCHAGLHKKYFKTHKSKTTI